MKTLIRCVWFSLLVTALTAHSAYSQESLKIRVGNFFPNYYQDASGEWQGIDVELTRLLAETAGFKAEFFELPWSRGLAMAQNGTIDIIPNANIKEERSSYLYWIGPARYTKMQLTVLTDNVDMPINSLDDFVTICQKRKKSFGYQNDVKYSAAFHQKLETDTAFRNCFEAVSTNLNAIKTKSGRILGYFGEPMDIVAEKKKDPGYPLAVHPFILSAEPVFFGISKQSVSIPTLIKLYAAYEKIVENGTVFKVRQKWSSNGDTP